MYYPDYLIHFNKNHSPKNGQFVSGDGDGDGIVDDHHYKSKTISRYTGANADKNLQKDGRYKISKNFRKEIDRQRIKQYGIFGNHSRKGIGKNSIAAEKKQDKLFKDLEKEAVIKYNKNKKKYDNLGYDLDDIVMDLYDDHRYSNVVNKDIAYLMDMGYDKAGAKKVAEYLSYPYATYSIG